MDKSSFESINGRGGENVERLRRKYGVEIDLKDGKVIIMGKKVRVEAARRAIDSILYDRAKEKIFAEFLCFSYLCNLSSYS